MVDENEEGGCSFQVRLKVKESLLYFMLSCAEIAGPLTIIYSVRDFEYLLIKG